MPLLPHFPFQRNPREFIDNVPQLSRVFLCQFDAAQQRQSKVYLKRTRRAVSAASPPLESAVSWFGVATQSS